jgi:hypothetical protein
MLPQEGRSRSGSEATDILILVSIIALLVAPIPGPGTLAAGLGLRRGSSWALGFAGPVVVRQRGRIRA